MESLNIICVKIGRKYDTSMVNNLFRMCQKNITKPFNFFCYTDDSAGVDKQIKCIDYIDQGFDVVVYNKLYLFSEQFDSQLPDGPRLYFDLDLVIKSNIDDIVDHNKGNLSVIHAVWRKKHEYNTLEHHHPFNSSCMTWRSPYTRPIWEHFTKDPEMFMAKYYWGMDSFMFYEHEAAGVGVSFFPEMKFYSHLYGVDYHMNEQYDPVDFGYRPSKFVEIVKKIPVVLLNGPTTPRDYQSYANFYQL